jgi:hypothetical protein
MTLGGDQFYLAMGFSPVKAAEGRISFESLRSFFIKTSLFPMILCKKNYDKYRYWKNWLSSIIPRTLF